MIQNFSKFIFLFLESTYFNSCKNAIKKNFRPIFPFMMVWDLEKFSKKFFSKKIFFAPKVSKWSNSKSYHVKSEIWRPSIFFLYQVTGSTLRNFSKIFRKKNFAQKFLNGPSWTILTSWISLTSWTPTSKSISSTIQVITSPRGSKEVHLFCMKLAFNKSRKVTKPDFLKKKCVSKLFRYLSPK